MKKTLATLTALLLLAGLALADEKGKPVVKEKPRVEVVFVLDSTGSMSSLIAGAKRKIWSIADRIASGKPTPMVRIGIVTYRDRGDAYVTKRFDLTEDLDEMFKNLSTIQAGGGGDGPESVNQALFEAVHKMSWSKDDGPLKVIYLVGDAPPHMDYAQDVKYPVTCKAAIERSIMINTIQCGTWAQTRTIWTDIASRSEGTFIAISQSGGMTSVATPYDKKLAELGRKMGTTYVAYGDEKLRRSLGKKAEEAEAAADAAPAPAAAARASYKAKAGFVAAADLVAMVMAGKVKLADVKKEHLPKELRDLSAEALKSRVDALVAQRKALQTQIRELSSKRDAFLAAWHKKHRSKEGQAFDSKVLETLKKAAKKKGIEYKD